MNISSRKQEAVSKKQEAGSKKQEARSKKQEAEIYVAALPRVFILASRSLLPASLGLAPGFIYPFRTT
jgi:hypothetical protein